MYNARTPLAPQRAGFADGYPYVTPEMVADGLRDLMDTPYPSWTEPPTVAALRMVSRPEVRDDIIREMLIPPTCASVTVSRDGFSAAVRSPSNGTAIAIGLGILTCAAGAVLLWPHNT